MSEVKRYDVNEEWAHSGVVEAGDYVFVNYCSIGLDLPMEDQVRGAFDQLEKRLQLVGLTLESVVKIDALFGDIRDIPIMEKVIKERFHGKYPARKSFERDHSGKHTFQVDAIAYKG